MSERRGTVYIRRGGSQYGAMIRSYADTAHGQIHVTEAGTGAPLVLLHPTPYSARVFVPLIEQLAGRFHVLALDTLGFGNSDPLPPAATMEMLAESVTGVLGARGLARAHVFGFHTGNKIAAALAAGWPQHVERVILCGMTHSLIPDRATRDAAIGDIVNRYMIGEGGAASRVALLEQWSTLFGQITREWWDAGVLGGDALSAADLARQGTRVIDRIQARASFDAVYAANFAFDLGQALGRIEAPTLVLELLTPGEAHFGIQGPACLAILRDGHLVKLEASDQDMFAPRVTDLANTIVDFLAGGGAPS